MSNDTDEEIIKLSEEIRLLSRSLGRLASWRLISMAAAFVVLLVAMWTGRLWLYLAALFGLGSFVFFLRQFQKETQQRDYKKAMRTIYQDRLSRRQAGWTSFPENGQSIFSKLEAKALHRFHLAKDLDVLGRDSLYQRISLAFSDKAKSRLSDYLLTTEADAKTIRERQAAVRELSEKDDFALHMATLIELARTKESKQRKAQAQLFIHNAAKKSSAISALRLPRRVAIVLFPLVMILLICALIIWADIPLLLSLASALGITQLLAAMIRLPHTNRTLEGIEGFKAYIEIYQSMIEAIEDRSFESDLLSDLSAKLYDTDGARASVSLTKLGKLANRATSRQNTLAWIISNAILFWDEHCVDSYRKWRDQAGDQIETWLDVCSEYEALLSLAASTQCYEHYCWPTVHENRPMENTMASSGPNLNFEELHHPLIDTKRSVSNDARLAQGSYIITGSNMSGKTTYLRAIGLSVLMAQAGCCIPAKSADITALTIHSSIRVDDNVAAGISSFYAEILRIRAMVEAARSGEPMLLLIDEIFRGTNSADRVTGAYEAIRRLSLPHVLLLVSTHDMELCDLEQDPAVNAINYHFSEQYVNDQIQFDYKLREGRSKTTNARFLLRMAGIITDDKIE